MSSYWAQAVLVEGRLYREVAGLDMGEYVGPVISGDGEAGKVGLCGQCGITDLDAGAAQANFDALARVVGAPAAFPPCDLLVHSIS